MPSCTPDLTVRLCRSPEDLAAQLAIRYAVFCDEQGYSREEELDGKDDASDHLLALLHDEPIGTIRYYSPASKLGRLAVLKKGLGAGRVLVEALESHIRARQGKSGVATVGKQEVLVQASSQAHAEEFYAKCGYVREGEEYLEEGEPHLLVTKLITLD